MTTEQSPEEVLRYDPERCRCGHVRLVHSSHLCHWPGCNCQQYEHALITPIPPKDENG
jgi:hypothetical protein